MRLIFLIPTILISSLILMSCSTSKKNTKNAEQKNTVKLTDTYWKLLDINGEAIPQKLNKEPFIQFDEKEKRVFGTNGCNTFFGNFDLNKNQIKFDQIAGTLMACTNSMEVESNMSLLMSSAAQYTINGNILILQNTKTNITARFTAVENASLNGTWTLTTLSTSKESLDQLFPNKKPYLEFDLSSEKVSGNGGCNQINSQIKVAKNTISFGPIASTRMACPGEGESIFLKALESANRFSLSKDKKELTLFRGDLLIMRFERTK